MKKLYIFIRKLFTHNYCDCCGLTEANVYTTEIFSEGGMKECLKCYNERIDG